MVTSVGLGPKFNAVLPALVARAEAPPSVGDCVAGFVASVLTTSDPATVTSNPSASDPSTGAMGDVLVTDWVDTTNTSLLVEATVGTPDSTPLFEMSLGAPCFELPPVVTLVVVDVEPAPAADAITVAAESLVEKAADILPHVGTTDAAIEPDDGTGRPLVFKLNSPVNPVPLPLIDAAVAGAIFESVDVTLEPLLWSFDELTETTGLPPLPSALVRFTDLSLDAEVELTGLSLATEVELPSRNPLVATAINTLSKDDVTVVTALAPPAVVVDDALPVTEVTSVAKVLAPPTEVTIDDLVSPTTVADDVRPTDDVVAAEVLVPPGTAPPDLTPPPSLELTLMPPELVTVAVGLLATLVEATTLSRPLLTGIAGPDLVIEVLDAGAVPPLL